MRGPTGTYKLIKTPVESYRAFIPKPLPPEPPLNFQSLMLLLDNANRSLGRLDGMTLQLPESSLFIYLYARKEAVLSSQIEGTQSSLSDLLLYESELLPGTPLSDVEEVSTYVQAMNHGIERVRGGFPISSRLLRELHGILLSKGRGSGMIPGEFRISQNWIHGSRPGDAVFVPPPPEEIANLVGDLETFYHSSSDTLPALIRVALVHAQFETIHPFLDGNGRLGRLLITLILCAEKILTEPMLYLSIYFKAHRQMYYDHLQRIRTDGDWEGWLAFFLEGVHETAHRVVDTARMTLDLFSKDADRLGMQARGSGSLLRIHRVLQKYPIISISVAKRLTGLSRQTLYLCFRRLEEQNVLLEISGRKRNKLFAYAQYLTLLNEGTEPIS